MTPVSPSLALALLAALVCAPQEPGDKPPQPAAGEDLPKQYFEIADYDANGWLTISEAKPSMGIDRRTFALYDEDGDGRISLDEFRARYEKLVKNGGAFPAPIGKGGLRTNGTQAPSELALRFDEDGDQALNRSELRAFLSALHSRLDADVVLLNFDRDGSRRISKGEITELAAFLDPERRSHPPPRAASIEELFGKSIPREERKDATQIAPLILGPVPVFRRLDLDADGRISNVDLIGLQRPIQLPVRIGPVIATLDTNLDGTIDAAEFDASMSGK
jgi:Ca2+-binding EF-hand superfamily protein